MRTFELRRLFSGGGHKKLTLKPRKAGSFRTLKNLEPFFIEEAGKDATSQVAS